MAEAPREASLWQHLRHLAWPELRHQPWRNLTALLAVVLGVALAFSVHLINESALSEFSAAVRGVNGQADFELRAQREGFDEALYDQVSHHPGIALASPVVDIETLAMVDGQRVPVRVLGLDALVAPQLNPDLLPRPDPGADRLALLQPDAAFPNDSARQQLGLPGVPGDTPPTLALQQGLETVPLRVQGRVGLGGEPVVVMDIAGAQERFGWLGRLSRIEVRLQPGADRAQILGALALPPGVRAVDPEEAAQRVSNLSRAYRVNLTVLALVALFTGSFLVFSVLSLSVARRTAQFALLGVLGLSARERLRLVLAESALLGLAGSLLGLGLGTALADAALRLLAGDLGGGYFPGVTPTLRFSPWAALLYGSLGVGAALVGGWLPARMAQGLAPAQALKGLGGHGGDAHRPWAGPALLGLGGLLALSPPVGGMPLGAYLSVACLLLGGIACVPAGVAWLLGAAAGARQARWLQRHPLVLLATARARHQRHTATIAVAGVVASLALSVALTVMVSSFRHAVVDWLDTVLPADLYVRSSVSAASDNVFLPPALVQAVTQLPGVARLETQRVVHLQLDPAQPSVTLLARPLPDPARDLPLVAMPLPPLPGEVNVYVSEAMASVYGAGPGTTLTLPLVPGRPPEQVQVRGVWRDYARQSGSIMMAAADFERLTGDDRANDLALWLQPGATAAEVQAGIREAVRRSGGGEAAEALLEFSSPGEIRAISLRIFDRSFAVTYWLQAVAIAIGLFGVAASFSAQVLARRKEFGLLTHLGLTRRQILALVAGEGAVWSATGALLGWALGLAVSVVLVKVVNPQSFHWTMDLAPPWPRLALLCLMVLAAGTLTAWLSAWRVGAKDAAKSVKEDW